MFEELLGLVEESLGSLVGLDSGLTELPLHHSFAHAVQQRAVEEVVLAIERRGGKVRRLVELVVLEVGLDEEERDGLHVPREPSIRRPRVPGLVALALKALMDAREELMERLDDASFTCTVCLRGALEAIGERRRLPFTTVTLELGV